MEGVPEEVRPFQKVGTEDFLLLSWQQTLWRCKRPKIVGCSRPPTCARRRCWPWRSPSSCHPGAQSQWEQQLCTAQCSWWSGCDRRSQESTKRWPSCKQRVPGRHWRGSARMAARWRPGWQSGYRCHRQKRPRSCSGQSLRLWPRWWSACRRSRQGWCAGLSPRRWFSPRGTSWSVEIKHYQVVIPYLVTEFIILLLHLSVTDRMSKHVHLQLQRKPLTRITLGQNQSDPINQFITLCKWTRYIHLLYNNCVVAKLGTASTGKFINL